MISALWFWLTFSSIAAIRSTSLDPPKHLALCTPGWNSLAIESSLPGCWRTRHSRRYTRTSQSYLLCMLIHIITQMDVEFLTNGLIFVPKGWPMYAQLLIDLFKYLAPFLRNVELNKPMQILYKVCY